MDYGKKKKVLLAYINTEIETIQFDPPIDSSNMSPELWSKLVSIISENYDHYDGFVILHGTDTMAYTASALSFMLENLTKPVILTGSQLPIGQLRTDGKENLMTSIELASAYEPNGCATVPEVCIYFSGHLLRGNRSTKINADEFNAFESFNYPHLCEAGVNFTFHRHHILKPDFTKPLDHDATRMCIFQHEYRSLYGSDSGPAAALPGDGPVPHTEMNPNVVVFSLTPGIQKDIFSHLLDDIHLRGIVMRSFGSGNAPRCPGSWTFWLRPASVEWPSST